MYYGPHFPVLCLSRVANSSLIRECGILVADDEKFWQFCKGLSGYLPEANSIEIRSEIHKQVQAFLGPYYWAEYMLWHREVVLPSKWEEERGWPIMQLALRWWTKEVGSEYLLSSGCSLIKDTQSMGYKFPVGVDQTISDQAIDSEESSPMESFLPIELVELIEMHRFQCRVSLCDLEKCSKEIDELETFANSRVIGEQNIQYDGPQLKLIDLRNKILRKLRL